MEKAKARGKKGSAYDPKHANPSVNYGGGDAMSWGCKAAFGMNSLIFIFINSSW